MPPSLRDFLCGAKNRSPPISVSLYIYKVAHNLFLRHCSNSFANSYNRSPYNRSHCIFAYKFLLAICLGESLSLSIRVIELLIKQISNGKFKQRNVYT